ncbi:Glycosyl transferase family 39 [Candidatus Terasakiella magnetica]|uniref:Glycosyl transferase family 39 n=1 Tax=Candidatus Terasakiella magnetica TaxID=1867952 RepID=A0A1C3RIN2_9PROT|nr:glycosyltransferase family 39 protein [Candidatus Terasakiella magnetica]SCA57116.1 Glycosyl transferase family 39 [Candidatus Terasakiella magnetica]
MLQKHWSPITFTLLWLVLVATAVLTRPALPVDETRYLAVAWEMWLRGDFIVPHLNGETYSHKPPLLFWIMNLGWAVFGVNDWWPPMVAPLFALACLFLTRAMAQKLWPEEKLIADLSPIILLGAVFWTIFTTVTMFDMLVAACTLWGLLGLLMVWRDGDQKGWWFLTLAIGVGVLAKGPVILLQILPIALLLPLWDVERRIENRKKWYRNILLSVLGGAVIALAWAVPAGILGGEEYRDAIFWGQTAGRVVKSFAHARPWWWYLAVIGPLLLPWVIWPILWKAAWQGGKNLLGQAQVRFCILWFVPIFFAFSLISGKQLHYLLPIFPAFAFMLARLLVKEDTKVSRVGRIVPAGFVIILGLAVLVAPYLGIKKFPTWALELPTYWMALPILCGLYVVTQKLKTQCGAILSLTSMMTALVVAIHLVMAPYLGAAFDLKDMSLKIKDMQDEGYDVAFMAKYHGTFQFLGRLEKPIAELSTTRGHNLNEWLAAHPKSKVITLWKQAAPDHVAVEYVQNFRNNNFIIFDVEKLNGAHELLNRRGKAK